MVSQRGQAFQSRDRIGATGWRAPSLAWRVVSREERREHAAQAGCRDLAVMEQQFAARRVDHKARVYQVHVSQVLVLDRDNAAAADLGSDVNSIWQRHKRTYCAQLDRE